MGGTCCTTNTLDSGSLLRNVEPPQKAGKITKDNKESVEVAAKSRVDEEKPETASSTAKDRKKKRKIAKKKVDKEDDKETYTNGPIPNAMSSDTSGSSSSDSSSSSEDSIGSEGKKPKNTKQDNGNAESRKETPTNASNTTNTSTDSLKTFDITLAKGYGLTIILTGPPGEAVELPSKKGRKIKESTDPNNENSSDNGGASNVVTKPSEKYVVPDDVEKPQWLEKDSAFFNSLGAFVSKCNTNLKTAIWKKCFTRQDNTLVQIAAINDITKLISAMVMVYLKVRSKTNVKEKVIRPHVMGCAQFIADAYREIIQKDFVQSKNYFSNMLKQYHAYLQDLQGVKSP